MRIPPHWARGSYTGYDSDGHKQTFVAWGWSFDSFNDALAQGIARAERIFNLITAGIRPDTYDYLDQPLREEIVQTIGGADAPAAVITRNRYGALVLNSAAVCFVDIDFPPVQAQGVLDRVRLWLRPALRRARAAAAQADTIAAVTHWAQDHPRRAFRLYRTAAGLRLLFTDRLYDPLAAETVALLRELGSDPLYRKLTQKQGCFRARLTPKPWRCGGTAPPYRWRYPWDSAESEHHFRRWQTRYEQQAGPFATCRLLDTFGTPIPKQTITTLVALHDQYTLRDGADLA